jgi:ribosomal-protein-alanine N-acetyltransferase
MQAEYALISITGRLSPGAGNLRIQTERTHLTVLHERDSEAMATYYRDNADHLDPWEPARPEDFHGARSWRLRARKAQLDAQHGQSLRLVARHDITGALIGVCNFTNIQRGVAQCCDLGYSIAKQAEGQGLMQEIVSAGCQHMFQDQRLNRISAACLPHNTRSRALLERLGFEEIGRARQYLKIDGVWRDHDLWQKLNPEDI